MTYSTGETSLLSALGLAVDAESPEDDECRRECGDERDGYRDSGVRSRCSGERSRGGDDNEDGGDRILSDEEIMRWCMSPTEEVGTAIRESLRTFGKFD